MKHFTSYFGNYGELALDRHENMSKLHTSNINTITTQTHGFVPAYALPKSCTSIESVPEHWGYYIAANEERYKFSWREDYSGSNKRIFSCVKSIVE